MVFGATTLDRGASSDAVLDGAAMSLDFECLAAFCVLALQSVHVRVIVLQSRYVN